MSGKVRLVVSVVAAVAAAAGGVPTAAQQTPPAANQGTRVGLFASIEGMAINWNRAAMSNAPLRLRDARLGRSMGTTRSDPSGAFEFSRLEPGSYVVELLSADSEVVLATSPIISLDAGGTAATIVKVPFKKPPFGGWLGRSPSSALAIITAAAAAGVPATIVAGTPATDRALPGQR